MAEDLYKEELEFKELHNEFLKRPAAVTINKPFLSNNEMEDVLTRLLRNYVPPKYVDAYRVPSLSGGLGIRAILLCYRRPIVEQGTYTEHTKTLMKSGMIGYLGASQYATIPSYYENIEQENKIEFEKEKTPFAAYYIKWDDSVLISSDVPKETIYLLKQSAKDGKIDGKIVQDLEDGATADNQMYGLATDAEMDQKTGCVRQLPDDTESPGGIECYLYLFCKTDHDWMLLNPKTNHSENTVLARFKSLFQYNILPDYRGRTVVYYPDKNKQVSDRFFTRDVIKKAFGRLPYNEVAAHCWRFILRNSGKNSHTTLMHVTYNRATDLFKDAGNELSLDAFYNKIVFLADAMLQNKSLHLPTTYLDAGEKQPVRQIWNIVHSEIESTISSYYSRISPDPVTRRNQLLLTSEEFKTSEEYKTLVSKINRIRTIAKSLEARLSVWVKSAMYVYVDHVDAETGAFSTTNSNLFPFNYKNYNTRMACPIYKNNYDKATAIDQLPMMQSTWNQTWYTNVFGKKDSEIASILGINITDNININPLSGIKSQIASGDNIAATALRSIRQGYTDKGQAMDAAELLSKKTLDELAVGSVSHNLASTPTDTEAVKTYPDGFKRPVLIDDLYKALDDYEISVQGDISNANFFKHNNYYSLMPILPFDAGNRRLREIERANTRQANKEVDRVTTEGECDMYLLDFKVRYYSVLVEMLKKKVDKYSDFIDDGIMQFPLMQNFNKVYQMAHEMTSDGTSGFSAEERASLKDTEIKVFSTKEKVAYCSLCEELFFGVLSGFFITSNTRNNASVDAPIWNAMPSRDNMLAYNYTSGNVEKDKYYQMEGLKRFGNFDVSAINISKVVHGSSRANIEIKNDKDKYSFPRNAVLNRTEVCIEPMDRIVIYLPTYEDTIKPVFTGIVSTVTGKNDEGYHSLLLEVDCNLKNLKISRTNMKPSVVREENGNNKVTPFTAPMDMYASLEKWLPVVLMEACTYYSCMPAKATEADAGIKLFNYVNQRITQTVGVNRYKEDVIDANDTVSEDVVYKNGDAPAKVESATAALGFGSEGTLTRTKITNKETEKLQFTTVEVRGGRTTLYLGTFKAVNFADDLFNYLWYKSASKFPPEETAIITDAQSKIYREYIKTDIVDPAGKHKVKDGITPLHEELKNGNRCSYLVYKQRFQGTWRNTTMAGTDDRTLVATIIGTSQPTFFLSNQKQSYQQSNWKTNLQIITETADKMNFCFYCDNAGVIRFTPYNFDLTLLNTRNFSHGDNLGNIVDSYPMLHTRNAKSLEMETNPLVLTKQHVYSYDKAVSDQKVVNWLRLTGDFVLLKNQFIQAQVMDPVLIKKYGIHTGSPRNITGISSETSLQLYGLSWMDRQNKHIRSAKINGLYSADMDVNMPYYVPHDEIIYLCESLNITYTPGTTCTFSMGATYGKKPIIKINPDHVMLTTQNDYNCYTISKAGVDEISSQLETLFTINNEITPTVYAQYKHLFAAAGESNVYSPFTTGNLNRSDMLTNLAKVTNTKPISKLDLTQTLNVSSIMSSSRDAANPQYLPICCYNGYVWDGVSCISFEELVFNYGWLFAGKNVDGFRTTIAVGDNLVAEVADYVPSSYMGLNATEEAIRAMQAFMVDMPAIETNGDFPSTWKAESIYFTDLAQSPFVVANTPQTSVTKSKGIII